MLKNLFLLNIAYDGHCYHGFQIQKELPTIQGVISNLIKSEFEPNKFRLYCSSRTDARVHALDQYVLINSDIDYNDEFINFLKTSLPKDIKLLRAFRPPKGFDLIAGCEYKEYKYLFANMADDIDSKYFTNFIEPLDIELMKKACELIIGEHDFYNFQYKGRTPNTIRTILECSIDKADETFFTSEYPNQLYCMNVKGKGFMRHMVRIIMGSLVNVGSGQIELETLENSLKDRPIRSGFITPPQGLYQYKTVFPDL